MMSNLPRPAAVLTGVVLALSILVLSPVRAEATVESSGPTLYLLGSAPVAGLALTFTIADVYYASDARLLPTGWAIPQLIGGLAEVAWGGLGVAVANDGYNVDGGVMAVAGITLGIGAWHVIHAIWSLAADDAPPPVNQGWAMTVAPTEGGGMLQIVGRL